MKKKFTFGLVKDKNMVDIINSYDIGNGHSGIEYLYVQFHRQCAIFVKEEIEYCLMNYAKDYILEFGRYRGKTIEDIEKMDSTYVSDYLAKAKNPFIKWLVEYYLIFKKKRFYMINKKINMLPAADMRIILHSLDAFVKEKDKIKGYDKCPFCGATSEYGIWPVQFFYGRDNDYFFKCRACGDIQELIPFMIKETKLSYSKVIDTIAKMLNIYIGYWDIKDIVLPEEEIHEDTIILERKQLAPIDLGNFGFEGKMHPNLKCVYGLSDWDREKYDIQYAGRNCKDKILKNRICFLVKHNDSVVGVVGLNSMDEDMFEKSHDTEDYYKAYLFNKGFKKSYTLFNLDEALKTKFCNNLYICENPLEVIELEKDLFGTGKAVVGAMGEILSKAQLNLIFDAYRYKRMSLNVHLCIRDKKDINMAKINARALKELGFKNIYISPLKNTGKSLSIDYDNQQYFDEDIKKKIIILHDLDKNENIQLEGLEQEADREEKGFLDELNELENMSDIFRT